MTPPRPLRSTSSSPTIEYLNCKTENGAPKNDGFCPLAWDSRSPRDTSDSAMDAKSFRLGQHQTDPRYKGKYVGFAVIGGKPALSCKENKYSMVGHNTKNSLGTPWVASLIYQSTAIRKALHGLAKTCESPADWRRVGRHVQERRRVNDFVFLRIGHQLPGWGQPCGTRAQGACSVGRTDCASRARRDVSPDHHGRRRAV